MAKNSARKKKSKEKSEEYSRKKGFREKFTEMLELPKELLLNIPRITMAGNGDMMVENYKGLIEYGRARIRISTGPGTVKITGLGLIIREITSDDIIISGNIQTLEFLYAVNDTEHTG
jgi:sporulation protein YqfC